MLIECQECQKSYTLPDERLPHGKVVSFPCPRCKNKITLDLRPQSIEEDEADEDTGSSHTVFRPLDESEVDELNIDEFKKKILKKINDLPPMPKVLFKARKVLSDPNSSFKEISKIIETDQAIAAKVLKVANSAYYGLSGMVSSIHQASVVLGYQTLEQVITMVSSSAMLGKQLKGYGLNAGMLWKHSLATALASRLIAKRRAPSMENDAFSVGLIHDAGKLALDKYLSEKQNEVKAFLRDQSPSFLEAERHVLGFDHTDMAFELCQKWKLPENHAAAMRYHHSPENANGNQLAYIVYVANYVAEKAGYSGGPGFDESQISESNLETLRLKMEDLDELASEVATAVEQITNTLAA